MDYLTLRIGELCVRTQDSIYYSSVNPKTSQQTSYTFADPVVEQLELRVIGQKVIIDEAHFR